MIKTAYETFLKSKESKFKDSGFEISESKLNPALFDFQKYIVKLALQKGRYALFEDCGLGKTLQQLEWSKQITKKEKKSVLIVCPLAVSGQTIKEGLKFGYDVARIEDKSKDRIYITNYEQLNNIDVSEFIGVVLDESSILKNFTGAYRNLLIDLFKHTKYKLCCTATPSPNDYTELGNHSEFLGYMKRLEMLSKYFRHEGSDTSEWNLKRHAIKPFWQWVSGWATMILKPSDIGFEDFKFKLPEINYIEKKIIISHLSENTLFRDAIVSATNFNAELRVSMNERLNETANIVNNSTENFIIWVKQNVEGDYLRNLIPDAIEVKGNEDPKTKERKLLDFADNKFRVLITKTKIAQFGLNYQNCNNEIFPSLDFSFESTYQAIRRVYRYGQEKNVNIYFITTDTMSNVINAIKSKQENFYSMLNQFKKIVYEKDRLQVA